MTVPVWKGGAPLWIDGGGGVLVPAWATDPCDCCGPYDVCQDCQSAIGQISVSLSGFVRSPASGRCSGTVEPCPDYDGAHFDHRAMNRTLRLVKETATIWGFDMGTSGSLADPGWYLYRESSRTSYSKTYAYRVEASVACVGDDLTIQVTYRWQTFRSAIFAEDQCDNMPLEITTLASQGFMFWNWSLPWQTYCECATLPTRDKLGPDCDVPYNVSCDVQLGLPNCAGLPPPDPPPPPEPPEPLPPGNDCRCTGAGGVPDSLAVTIDRVQNANCPCGNVDGSYSLDYVGETVDGCQFNLEVPIAQGGIKALGYCSLRDDDFYITRVWIDFNMIGDGTAPNIEIDAWASMWIEAENNPAGNPLQRISWRLFETKPTQDLNESAPCDHFIGKRLPSYAIFHPVGYCNYHPLSTCDITL